jgi:ketosteroid isomerase-like protein
MTMSTDTQAVAETYFEAWRAHDFARLREVLADDVTFRGPLGTADGADEAIRGLEGMAKSVMADIVVEKMFVDGPDVVTWFTLHTPAGDRLPTANWSHVEDGKVTRIRVAFDPRPIAPPEED